MEKSVKDATLEKVMIENGDELVRLALSYVKDLQTAKDMVQNTFVKSYENLDSFRNDAKLKTWLYRITINECKDYLKSWHYKKVIAKKYFFETSTSRVPSAESTMFQEVRNQEIRSTILSLPVKYQEVINLYYLKSLKIEEIAEVTGLQMNTVKTRLRRAKQQLKYSLEEESYE